MYKDLHSSFQGMTQDFPGVEVDVGGSGDYMAKVDVKVSRTEK
jgi:hypothetical protein